MNIKGIFLNFDSFVVGDIFHLHFWEDSWYGQQSFKDRFLNLYGIVRRKNVTLRSVLSTIPLNVEFRRTIAGAHLNDWLQIVAIAMQVELSDQKYRFRWALHQSGAFSVKTMYRVLNITHALPFNMYTWSLKVPLKIKICVWYLYKSVTITKDNVARKNWQGDLKCSFCNVDENIQYLFFDCPLARFIWHIIHVSFNITPPTSFHHIFTHWLGATKIGVKKYLEWDLCHLIGYMVV
jgi:hypothetical protein